MVLGVLNKTLLALGAAANDHTIGPITEKQLPPIVLGFKGNMCNLRGEEIDGLESFMYTVHKIRGVRSEDHNASVINYALSITHHADHGPFYPPMEFLFAARRSFDMGLLSQAVLEAGTAVELLVNRVVRGIELEKGSTPEQIDKLLEAGLKNLAKDHFGRRLGVPVDPRGGGSDPLNEWLRTAYKLRNDVAHEGRKPTRQEAAEAIGLAHTLVNFVGDAIERGGGFGITFPHGERRPHPMLDERSMARADSSSLPMVRKNAFWRGRAAARSGDSEAAKEAFVEADEQGGAGAAYNLAVLYLTEDGNEAAGIAALRRAVERGHPVAPAHLGAYLLESGDEAEAEKLFLQTSSAHPVGGSLAAYYLGGIVGGRGELAEAAGYYEQASIYDEFAFAGDAAFRRGLILQELGEPSAVGAYARGAELGSVEAASYLAYLLRTRGETDAAIVACERALALSDPDTEGWIIFNLAALLDALGHSVAAKPVYQRAADIGETRALIRLAGMAAEANDERTAKEYLVAARATGDSTVQALAAKLSVELRIALD